MYGHRLLSRAHFDLYLEVDRDLATRTRAGDCQHCGGALHTSNYRRDPQGLPFAATRMDQTRLSLCCSQEGCRCRATPPSIRFFGRRFLVAPLFVLLCAMRDRRRVTELCALLEVDRRTIARWRVWWRDKFVLTRVWGALRGLLPAEATREDEQPRGLLVALGGLRPRPVRDLLRLLCPLTTASDWSHVP